MSTNKEKRFRYFLYSAEQETLRKDIEDKVGKQFVVGEVMVNGTWKPFTQLSKTSDSDMFADAKVVAKGYIEDMQYTEPSSKWKVEG